MSYLEELDKADIFIREFRQSEAEKDRIDILIRAVLALRLAEPEKCLILSDEIIERSRDINYKKGIGNGYNHKGACYWILGEYEDGLDELTMALEIAHEIKDEDLEAKALNNFGRIYRDLGDLANALRNFEASMLLNEKLENEVNLSINLINISTLYYDLGDYDTALEYALRTLPIFEKHKDIHKQVHMYNTLGNIFFKQESFNEAEQYFEKIIEADQGNSLYRAMAESGLGKVYFKKGNFPAAREYLYMALEKARANNSFETEIVALFYLSRLYLAQNDLETSLQYGLDGYKLAEEYHRMQDVMSFHEILSSIYDRMGDVQEAFHHIKKFEALKEQIFKQATLNKLRNLQIKNQVLFARKEKEVAEKTAQLKQQFMANMSHEIRTPMNAIVGLVNLLINRDPKPDQIRYLTAIQRSADNLLVIINDILDFSKIEAGKVVLEHIPFSLKHTVDSIYNTLFLRAEERGLEFNIHVDEQIPEVLVGDPTRLSQILINLIGNAIKFTEEGSVTLNALLEKQVNEMCYVRFEIKDTGIGIAEDYVKKIFESFTQAGTDTARKYGGTGLGLTISKQLTDLMNGNIEVESELGKGTVFFVTIPFGTGAGQLPDEQKKEEIDMGSLTGLSILLVEDNEFNVMVAEETLQELLPKVKIDIAENGKVAVDKLKNGYRYDIVLMDIQMPVMDGIEATKNIRNNPDPDIARTKIIALTANAFEEDIRKYFRIGMNGYITKPFRQEELINEVASVLANEGQILRKKEEDVEQEEAKTLRIPDQITDMSFMQSFTGGNKEKMEKYRSMFLQNAPRLLEEIRNGLRNNDDERIKIAAHSLKPQLGYMGVKEEVSNIYLLEKSAGEHAHHHTLAGLVERLELVISQCIKELSQKL